MQLDGSVCKVFAILKKCVIKYAAGNFSKLLRNLHTVHHFLWQCDKNQKYLWAVAKGNHFTLDRLCKMKADYLWWLLGSYFWKAEIERQTKVPSLSTTIAAAIFAHTKWNAACKATRAIRELHATPTMSCNTAGRTKSNQIKTKTFKFLFLSVILLLMKVN